MDFLRSLFGLGAKEEEEAGSSGTFKHPARSPAGDLPAGDSKRLKRRPPSPPEPLLTDIPPGSKGGVQGLDWYHASLRRDEEGDIAQTFVAEANGGGQREVPRHAALGPGTSTISVSGGHINVVPITPPR